MRKKQIEQEEDVTFYEFSQFAFYLETEKHLSSNTISSYLNDLKDYGNFLKKYEKIDFISEVTEIHLNKYILSLKRKDLAKKSIQRKITAIKSFHKFILDEGLAMEDPSKLISNVKLDKSIPEVLTVEEVSKMIDSIDTSDPIGIRNKAILEVLYGSGLRVSELTSLKLINIHMNAKYISVIGKGDKERIVPMGEEEIVALRNYIENARPILSKNKNTNILFLNYQSNELSRQSVFKLIKEVALKNNIQKTISPHTLRHSCATHLLQNGVDLRVVQEFLGHEDISTTEIYTHIDKSHLKEVYKGAHPLAQIKEEKDEI